MQKTDIAQVITDSIVKQLEQGVAPWVKPWASKPSEGAPHNPASGTQYRGINFIWLSLLQSSGDFGTSSQWMTYKQAQTMGANVRKGAKGVQVIFYKPLEVSGEVNPSTGKKDSKVIPMLKTYTVFNADFIDGLPVDEVEITEEKTEFQTLAECEQFIAGSHAVIKHGGDRAFYSPSSDFIQLPNIKEISKEVGYYSTLLHELSHWTGNEKRLKREIFNRFGSNGYAFEELVAEISSGFLCTMLELVKLPTPNHARYINNWLEVLKSDKKAIVKAFSLAQKASDFILDHEEIKELEEVA